MKRRIFSAELKRESAQLVPDQNYTVADAASAMNAGLSTMTRWVKLLRDERQFAVTEPVSMKHESYLAFCLRIRHPYQNR